MFVVCRERPVVTASATSAVGWNEARSTACGASTVRGGMKRIPPYKLHGRTKGFTVVGLETNIGGLGLVSVATS